MRQDLEASREAKAADDGGRVSAAELGRDLGQVLPDRDNGACRSSTWGPGPLVRDLPIGGRICWHT